MQKKIARDEDELKELYDEYLFEKKPLEILTKFNLQEYNKIGVPKELSYDQFNQREVRKLLGMPKHDNRPAVFEYKTYEIDEE